MTGWLPTLLASVIASLVGLAAAWLSYRQASTASETKFRLAAEAARVEALRVDAAAYARAKELYEASISQLERQLARVQTQMAHDQSVSDQLRAQVNALDTTVEKMRAILKLHGISDGYSNPLMEGA